MYDDRKWRYNGATAPENSGERGPSTEHRGEKARPPGETEMLWVRGPDGRTLVHVDPAAGTLWDLDTQTLLSNPEALIDAVHPDDRESLSRVFNGRQEDEYASLECRIVLPDGAIRWIRARSLSIRDKDGEVLYTFGAATDITEVKHAAVALVNAARQQADFLAIASHELRTPLQPILGYLYLILDSPRDFGLTAEGMQYLKVVQECANRVSEVVNRILAASLTDTEQVLVQLRWETVLLTDLITDVVSVCSAGDGMTYAVEIPPDLTIETDRGHLYEILSEICMNVVKHSGPPRHVVFGYAEEPGVHVLSIADGGPGMDEATRRNAFRPFYIGNENKLSRMPGCLGLGLTIAKKDVERLGGTISVESSPLHGNTFTIRLPKQHMTGT
jgi:PAS domain S-box-containing protein